MFDQYFSEAQKLREAGTPFATATVVRAERPTSAKPGDKAIITLDGVMHGWIGGSCAQPTVVREALRAIADDRARLVRLSPNPEQEPATVGVEVCKMTCYSGGTLDIHIEPQAPQPELRIAGHLPVAQALAHLAKQLGFTVRAMVAPGEQASMEHADHVSTRWKDLGEPATPLTFVVVATHGHDDEEALEHALDSGARYVGLVASPKRARNVRAYLELRGLGPEKLGERLHAPAGLDLGARRGDEIALSILAEIVQIRRAVEVLDWPPASGARASQNEHEATAVDPVCGMEVRIEGAKQTHEHGGTLYYFCCGGCRAAFEGEPSKYLKSEAARAAEPG
ncbi:MAG: XdhC family protein [Holophagales bacterium]|nr:XdhC family protein [Holophagales bacterium]